MGEGPDKRFGLQIISSIFTTNSLTQARLYRGLHLEELTTEAREMEQTRHIGRSEGILAQLCGSRQEQNKKCIQSTDISLLTIILLA